MKIGRHPRLVTLALVGALLVGACGDDNDAHGSSDTDERTDSVPSSTEAAVPDDPMPADIEATEGLVIRWTTRWWDPHLSAFGGPGQDIAVYADGTVVGTAAVEFEAQPMIWPYVTGRIDVADVQDLLARASAAGLLAASDFVDGNPDVAGAPVTFVELRTAGAWFEHRVHALQTPPDDDTEYLAALRDFVETLQEMTEPALDPDTAESLVPERVAVTARASGPPPSGAPLEWRGAFALADAVGCVTTDDSATIEQLRQALAREHFADAAGTYMVTAYQLVPGEPNCFGRSPSTPPPDEPQPVDGEVIRITTQPLFPVVPPFVPSGPEVVVYADGTVFASFTGSFAVQPMLWPYNTGTIDVAAVEELLALAADDELLRTSGSAPNFTVADAPVTTVRIRVAGETVVHQIAALASEPPTESAAYVEAVRAFVGRVNSATEQVRFDASGEFYEPQAVAIAAAPIEPPPNSSAPTDWTGGVRLADLAECTIVDDPAVLDALRAQYAHQLYVDGGVTYEVAARIAFPGDTTC